jgi:hypothetical protein
LPDRYVLIPVRTIGKVINQASIGLLLEEQYSFIERAQAIIKRASQLFAGLGD